MEHISDVPLQGRPFMLRGLCFAIVDEADSVLIDEAYMPLVLSRSVECEESMHSVYRQAMDLADRLNAHDDYQLVDSERQVVLTPRGSIRLVELSASLSTIWHANKPA